MLDPLVQGTRGIDVPDENWGRSDDLERSGLRITLADWNWSNLHVFDEESAVG